MSDLANEIAEALAARGVTMEAVFIPFSQSRHAKASDFSSDGKPWKSLNWKVTIKSNGRDVITTDFASGIGNTPSHSGKAPLRWTGNPKKWAEYAGAWEIENGYEAAPAMFNRGIGDRQDFVKRHRDKPLLPAIADVMHSLICDAGVLNSATFEDWASEYGYDPDSRKAEKIYRACLEIALQLRAGFGDSGMVEIAKLFEEY